MVTIYDILKKCREVNVTERQKGALFEKLMQRWLKSDPRYSNILEKVWLWDEFPGRTEFGGKDTGLEYIYKDGYSGFWATKLNKKGNGIGMFYAKKLMEKNEGWIEFKAGDKTEIMGIPYATNIVILAVKYVTDAKKKFK